MRRREEAAVDGLDMDAIVETLDTAPVTLAILYGSYARGDATSTSDIDLAVKFDESLTSSERTQARLAIIEQMSVAFETDDVDVIPLSRAPTELVEEILAEGILVYGSIDDLESYQQQSRDVRESTHKDRLEEFDELLAELDRVV